MKEYDFIKNELWFSRRALQWLTCSQRRTFLDHIRKAYISLSNQTRDTIRLKRNEGGRIVGRETDIFNLEASSAIVHTFSHADFEDYAVVSSRLDDLLEQSKKAEMDLLVSKIKEKNNGVVSPYISLDSVKTVDLDMLALLAGESSYPRRKRRIIVDLIDGELVQAFEDEVASTSGGDIRRARFAASGN